MHFPDVTVVKLSGKLLSNEQLPKTAEQIACVHQKNRRVVYVHGAGKQIDAELLRLGIKPKTHDGIRVTDEATLDVVQNTVRRVGFRLGDFLEQQGIQHTYLDGVLSAKKMESDYDYGFVGTITNVNHAAIHAFLQKGPVILPCLAYDGSQTYNVNADHAAAQIAVALDAQKLVMASDVPGIYTDATRKRVLQTVNKTQVQQLIDTQIISGGMIPKSLSATYAARHGISVQWVNGLLESFSQNI
ncbi:acetylglutamate kinase [Candidatus Micrarchaeota archaeon]|nr:acetylglutamate kinase [Candidatus Micrarchaeota archaeon]